jgi:hypothetical protein
VNLNEREPLAIRAAITVAVTTIVHVAVVSGLVDKALETPIATAVDAVGFVILVLWGRAGVTPNAQVVAQVTPTGSVVAGDASSVQTGASLDDAIDEIEPGIDPAPAVVVPLNPAKLAA